MGKMLKAALEFINKYPRVILLMAWPVFTAIFLWLIWIVWQGPWIVTAAMQMKQLDILAGFGIIIGSILGLNQLAQSSSFFGKLALKVGAVFDMNADMEPGSNQTQTAAPAQEAVEQAAPEETK